MIAASGRLSFSRRIRRSPISELRISNSARPDKRKEMSANGHASAHSPHFLHWNKSLRSFVFSSPAAPSRGLTPKISSIVFRVELWS
jgi:hypothetical protein